MPFKFHASRRHHIPRAKYRVMNWPDYDRGLVRRGDIRFWIDESALEQWDRSQAANSWWPAAVFRVGDFHDTDAGGGLQTAAAPDGRLCAVPRGLDGVRSAGAGSHHAVAAAANGGCRCGNQHEQAVYGYRAGFHGPEILWRWRVGSRPSTVKRGARGASCRSRLNPASSEIRTHELTGDDTADATMAGPLVAGSGGMIRRVFADGAYDGEPVTKAIREARPPNSPPEIIIPPRATSIPPPDTPHGGSEREHHAAEIASKGRMNWQKRQGYGLRALGETAMARVKRLNGGKLNARTFQSPTNRNRHADRRTQSLYPCGETKHNQDPLTNRGMGDHTIAAPCTKAGKRDRQSPARKPRITEIGQPKNP